MILIDNSDAATNAKAPASVGRLGYSLAEVAAAFGRSTVWAHRRVYAGELKVIRHGGRMLVSSAELQRFAGRSELYSARKAPLKQAGSKSTLDKASAEPQRKSGGKAVIWYSITFGEPVSLFAGRSSSGLLTFDVERRTKVCNN